MKNKLKETGGFTLVELIVVIAILGILAGVGGVAYAGYVERANKAVDQQMVADTEYAMALANVANNLGNTAGNGVIGYVIFSDTNNAIARDTLTSGGGTATTYLDQAMKNAFGDDYANQLKLKYGGWDDAATMLGEVADNEYAGSVNSSSYINQVGTEELLGDVQGCATALAGFMEELSEGAGGNAYDTLRAFLGEDLDRIFDEAGLEKTDSTGNVLANATVIGISNYVSRNQAGILGQFNGGARPSGDGGVWLDENQYILKNNLSDLYQNAATKEDILYYAATWYAAGEALVAYLDDEDCTNAFDAINMTGDTEEILNSMQSAYTSIEGRIGTDPNVAIKFRDYYLNEVEGGKSQAQLDGESYVAIMSTVNNLSGDYTNSQDLNSDSLFSNSGMVNRIDSYVAAASLKDLLGDSTYSDLTEVANGTAGSAVVVIVTADGNGNVGCIVCPADATM